MTTEFEAFQQGNVFCGPNTVWNGKLCVGKGDGHCKAGTLRANDGRCVAAGPQKGCKPFAKDTPIDAPTLAFRRMEGSEPATCARFCHDQATTHFVYSQRWGTCACVDAQNRPLPAQATPSCVMNPEQQLVAKCGQLTFYEFDRKDARASEPHPCNDKGNDFSQPCHAGAHGFVSGETCTVDVSSQYCGEGTTLGPDGKCSVVAKDPRKHQR